MSTPDPVRINYYVGAMLAQGGEVKIQDNRMIFSPTSALDRAMGAKDVEINLSVIQGLEYSGDLARTFRVKSGDRVHKFEGSHALHLAQMLEAALEDQGLKAKVAIEKKSSSGRPDAVTHCQKCNGSIRADFAYCPACGGQVRAVCPGCRNAVESAWVNCAFCGQKLENQKTA